MKKIRKEKSYRIRFSKGMIDAVLSVSGIIDNIKLGRESIANFGYLVFKLNEIKKQESGK